MIPKKIKIQCLGKNNEWYEQEVLCRRIVCPTCDGSGTHVNPNIDGNKEGIRKG